MAEFSGQDITALTVELLSAYVSNNQVPSNDLAALIQTTRAALQGEAASPVAVEEPEPEFKPAVTVRKSIASPDRIISLIDGKSYKTLKRHLAGHGLTPAEYRERYNLPKSYPMVAPTYSEHRRAVAKQLGLGHKPAVQTSPAEEAESVPAKQTRKPRVAKAKAAPTTPVRARKPRVAKAKD